MGFLIGLLTLLMVLDCLVLILLVLIQLPKKEAGAGLAFGGGATDALFGAGSGNVLTKITKYSAGIFFVLAVLLALLQKNYSGRRASAFAEKMKQEQSAPALPVPPAPAPGRSATPGATPSPSVPMNLFPTNAAPKPALEESNPPAMRTNVLPAPAPSVPK